MIKKVDHIGLAVSNLDNIIDIFTKLFNLKYRTISDHPSLKAAFLEVGDIEIEPLQPLDEKMSQWLNLSRQDNNIHHICFEVDDVELDSVTVTDFAAAGKGGLGAGELNAGGTDDANNAQLDNFTVTDLGADTPVVSEVQSQIIMITGG